MRTARLDTMTRGWFVGDFEPSVLRTDVCEVALRTYRRGEREDAHLHKVATELTLVFDGEVRMFDRTFGAGDIVVAEPGDATSFEALSDCTIVVVKTPSVKGDKYPAGA